MKKKINKTVASILILACIIPLIFIKKVEAGTYYVWSSSNNANFVITNGKYKGEQVSSVELVETQYKYKVIYTKEEINTYTIKCTEDRISQYKNAGKYNGFNITSIVKGKPAGRGSILVGQMEYYYYTITCRGSVKKEAITGWGKDKSAAGVRNYENVLAANVYDTKYLFYIITNGATSSNSSTTNSSSNSSTTNSSSNPSTTNPSGGTGSSNTSGQSYIDDLNVGDTLKFTGVSWILRSSDGGETIVGYLENGALVEIIEKGITTNYLKIKILSGKYAEQEKYLLYGSDAHQYFELVESAEITTEDENKKNTETIDNGTATENILTFVRTLYKKILEKSDEEANNDITKDNAIIQSVLQGETDAATLITYFMNLDTTNKEMTFEEYIKYIYDVLLQREITDTEIEKIKSQYNNNENYEAEIIRDIISSDEFKEICDKYSIKTGEYKVTKLNANTTETKATEFVKNLYSTLMNKTPSNEELTKIVENIVEGKITASSVLKAFFESDEFKNLKVSDEKYIEMLATVCWNKELTAEQKETYTKKLLEGTTRNELLKEFMNSDFAVICESYGLTKGNYEPGKLKSTNELATEFVKNVHDATLGADVQMVQGSTSNLITGRYSASDLIQIYIESSNFTTKVETENMSNSDYIKRLFKACLQRDAKSIDESKQYEDKIDNSYKSSVLAEFFKLDEYKELCNSYYLVPGQYTDNRENNESEATVENYENTGAKITTKERTLSSGETVKTITKVEFDTSTGLRGDVNSDGIIDISDATLVLQYVAVQQLYFEKTTEEVLKVADIDNDKIITVDDARHILQYYAMHAASLNPTWEDAIKASNEYEANNGVVKTNTTDTTNAENTTTATN